MYESHQGEFTQQERAWRVRVEGESLTPLGTCISSRALEHVDHGDDIRSEEEW